MDIDIYLGRRLLDKRTSSALSHERLARKLRIEPDEIDSYQKGVKRISAARLLHIALILGVRPNYFFHFSDEHQHSRRRTQ